MHDGQKPRPLHAKATRYQRTTHTSAGRTLDRAGRSPDTNRTRGARTPAAPPPRTQPTLRRRGSRRCRGRPRRAWSSPADGARKRPLFARAEPRQAPRGLHGASAVPWVNAATFKHVVLGRPWRSQTRPWRTPVDMTPLLPRRLQRLFALLSPRAVPRPSWPLRPAAVRGEFGIQCAVCVPRPRTHPLHAPAPNGTPRTEPRQGFREFAFEGRVSLRFSECLVKVRFSGPLPVPRRKLRQLSFRCGR
jgi:hypothetical protein